MNLFETLSYLSYIDPAQHLGALYRWKKNPSLYKNIDSIFDKDYWNLVRHNQGLVSTNFAKEHPLLSLGINMVGPGIITGGLTGSLYGSSKLLGKGARALYKTDVANRAKYVGLFGASGGVPAESMSNFKHIFLHGKNIGSEDPVSRLALAKYVVRGNRDNLINSGFTGYQGHINVHAPRDFDNLQSMRHILKYDNNTDLVALSTGLKDSKINVPLIYRQLLDVNLGMLPTPIPIKNGVIIGGKNAIKNKSLLEELDTRLVTGKLVTPIVGNVGTNTDNAYKALDLLNSGKEAIKSGVRGHSIKGKGYSQFDTGGINQYIYKAEDGSLQVVEVDIFDHAHTSSKGKYATDYKGRLKRKTIDTALKYAEDTPVIILNYHKGIGSSEFCNFALNNITDTVFNAIKSGDISKLTGPVSKRAINRHEMQRLMDLLADSKNGASLKYSFKPEIYRDIIRNELYKQCTAKGINLPKNDPIINAAADKLFNEISWYMGKAESHSLDYISESRHTFSGAREKLIRENTPEHFSLNEIEWMARNPKGTKKMVADSKAYRGINENPLLYILQEVNVQTPKKLVEATSTNYLNRQDLAKNALHIIREYSPSNREAFIKNYNRSSFKELNKNKLSELITNPQELDNYMAQLQSQLTEIDSAFSGIKKEYGTLPQMRISKYGGHLIPKAKSGIHIKKQNRGKFTSYCGGKVTDACIKKAKASGNPTLVKRATFAENARKWKH